MRWNKTIKANKWADMMVSYHKRMDEEKIITRWNWLVLEVGILLIIILLIYKS